MLLLVVARLLASYSMSKRHYIAHCMLVDNWLLTIYVSKFFWYKIACICSQDCVTFYDVDLCKLQMYDCDTYMAGISLFLF